MTMNKEYKNYRLICMTMQIINALSSKYKYYKILFLNNKQNTKIN